MRVLISGDPLFSDWKLFKKKVNLLTVKLNKVEIVLTGMAILEIYEAGRTYKVGAEGFAERWACERKYVYLVSREKKTKQRHEEAVSLAQAGIIFSSGRDDETLELLLACEARGLRHKVIHY